MVTLYVDTNIFIDAVGDRKNIFGKDIASPAARMFFDILSCKYYLALSTWTLNQIYRNMTVEEVSMLFNMIKKKIIKVAYDEEDQKKAEEKSKENYEDALHIVLAEKIKADIIVTRNVDHFIKIGTNIPVKRPEDL